MNKINIAIIGASGYTGVEAIRLLLQHPQATIKFLVADSNAGKPIAELYPHLAMSGLPDLVTFDKLLWDDIDVVFCCLPHGTAHQIIASIPESIKIIDLSSDFRFSDMALYEKWYGIEHKAKHIQPDVVYGLTEIYRDKIRNARIVACPGCYPTGAQLPLIPLLLKRLIASDRIIVDAKSGITGAGRAAKIPMLYAEASENMKAYAISTHRHTPEIEVGLSEAASVPVLVQFTPQLVPMNRGILSTIYITLAKGVCVDDLRHALQDFYQNEPFVDIMNADLLPSTREVMGTNICRISVVSGRREGEAVLVSVIDNLTKGSSGQAIQNMNVMYGIAENTGLTSVALVP